MKICKFSTILRDIDVIYNPQLDMILKILSDDLTDDGNISFQSKYVWLKF